MDTSMPSGRSTSASQNLQQVMRQHPLVSFFFLAYAISWILSIPGILTQWSAVPNPTLFTLFFTIKSFGPFLAAILMTHITEGKEGLRRLRQRIRQTRAGWQWYAFILLGVPAFMLLGPVVLPGGLASFQAPKPAFFAVNFLISFVLIFFGGGPLGEEPGWRGYALPRMQSRYGALRATMLLGVLWTFWHLPDFFTSAQGGGPVAGLSPFYTRLPLFFVMVMSLSFIFTWVFNHTGGSIFIALVLHAIFNTFGSTVQPLFLAPIISSTDLPFLIGTVLLAILIAILTRGKLGYVPGPEQSSSSGDR